MDLSGAIQYIAAIIVIVGAGVLLGMSLRRHQPLQAAHSQHERLQTYAELISSMDGLRSADERHKADFIAAYYRALIYAPDKVVVALNSFLQTITVPESQYDPGRQTAARDAAVLAMRRDAQQQLDGTTTLKPGNLFSIEVNAAGADSTRSDSTRSDSTVMKPESQVDTSSIMAEAETRQVKA